MSSFAVPPVDSSLIPEARVQRLSEFENAGLVGDRQQRSELFHKVRKSPDHVAQRAARCFIFI